jgi:hypothetical protein
MPGKSRQSRRKRSSPNKKRKDRRSSSAIVVQQQAVAPVHEPAALPEVPVPSASVPTSTATLTPARYPYIVTELRRIGILAGIMLLILVVLVLILP